MKQRYQSLESVISHELLPYIDKPVQYLGNEYNAVLKNPADMAATCAFCFPDTYEIGMSHLGMRILYDVTNADERFVCERSFAPLVDMENLMREKNIPLFTWENYHAVKDFDFVAFTLQYEMSYTNVLNMLDLAQIPVLAAERRTKDDIPVVMAGGPCAYNPEPLCDFIDLFVIGEGEDVNVELMELFVEVQKEFGGNRTAEMREAYLRRAAKIEGVYVPHLYEAKTDESGELVSTEPLLEDIPAVIKKRIIKDLDAVRFPTTPVVPFTQIVHDRVVLEVMRGCNRGCRFCQAGLIYRPVREKSVDVLRKQAKEALRSTGYDEIGMMSLSTADYSKVEDLIDCLMADNKADGVSVSLPSLRADAFSVGLAERVQQVRKSGLTFAPEAGSQRLRDVINKGVTEEDIISAATAAIKSGWSTIKLYFMAGLPYETEEDLDGIYDLAAKISNTKAEPQAGKKIRPVNVTVSVAFFVPKPMTPFQWFGRVSNEELAAKREYLFSKFKTLKRVRLSCHGVELGLLESCFARGGRELGPVLYDAWRLGCKFDGWHEHFQYGKWLQAFTDHGFDAESYAGRTFERESALPWDHISAGVNKKWLWREWEKAGKAATTLDCRKGPCNGCGVCQAVGCDNLYQNELDK